LYNVTLWHVSIAVGTLKLQRFVPLALGLLSYIFRC